MYTGICRGGPCDGQEVTSEHKKFMVPYRVPLPIKTFIETCNDIANGVPTPPCVKFGTYENVLGQWVWCDAAE